MSAGDLITITRDVAAVLIPLGTPVTIPEGAQVRITQELGGSYTVSISGNLARIDGKDADALGDAVAAQRKDEEKKNGAVAADGPVDMDAVWQVLKTCYDPEIPVNIVDPGAVRVMMISTW